MLLTGLNVEGTLRMREYNSKTETKDYLIDIFNKGAGKIQPDFGNLFFYLLPAGVISGADRDTIVTGYFAKFYATDLLEIATTVTGKIDKYETENEFIYQATASVTLDRLPVDVYVAKADLFYRGNTGSDALNVKVITTDAPQSSSFATADTNGKKGIKLSANSSADLSFTLTIKINKAAF